MSPANQNPAQSASDIADPAMSRWRLNRRKIFVATSLFISLFLFLHLPTPPPQFSPSFSPSHCLSYLHSITWTQLSWSWDKEKDKSAPCLFRRFSCADSSELLRGAWILVAGDSQARLVVLALLRILLERDEVASIEPDLFRRHSDYHIELHDRDIKVDFIWAPYESNLTNLLQKTRLNPPYPNIIILGSGLWHMLHFTDPLQYGNSLSQIKQSANSLLDPSLQIVPQIFWLGLPTLVNSLLNTKEKKERMNNTILEGYNREIEKTRILRQFGGPFFYINVGLLSRGCGARCAGDGMHYDGTVYEAAVNIVLNSFVFESRIRRDGVF